jgi:hypothetical protein
MATKKKMLMKGAKRTRRFDGGGSTDAYTGMSDAQKQWLGGADPTDPYILARMRRAVPDQAPSAPVRNMSDESYANSNASNNDYSDMQGNAEGMASNQLPARTAMSTAQTPVKTTRKPTSITQEKTKVTATVPKDYSDVNSRRTQQVGREAYENMQRLKAQDKPLEEVHPEDYVLPSGRMLKGVQKLASSLAGRNAIPTIQKAGTQLLESNPTLALGLDKAGTKLLENNPTLRLGFDKAGKMASDRAARASQRMQEMINENARNYGIDPENASQSLLKKLRENIGDGKFTMGNFKKGGKVKAFKQGGAVKTSASKRGDGCATKGFTRGKLK